MEQTSRKPANILSQARALMAKELVILRNNWFSNVVRIVCLVAICVAIFYVDRLYAKTKGAVKSNPNLIPPEKRYEMAHPVREPPLVRIPPPERRATRGNNIGGPDYYPDRPRPACRSRGTCPVLTLLTGMNRTTAAKLGGSLYGSEVSTEPSKPMDLYTAASTFTMGTYTSTDSDDSSLYIIQRRCKKNFAFQVSTEINGSTITQDVNCVRSLLLWREKHTDIIRELSKASDDEIFGAYDFLNTNERTFNVTVWYNDTNAVSVAHISRAINAASNSYLQNFRGSNMQMLLDFVKDMPTTIETSDPGSPTAAIQPALFMWLIASLSPMILHTLVYEKENRLRMIMKMHGLGDSPYWLISYAFFLLFSSAYILVLLLLGFTLGLSIFASNDASVLFVLLFVYINVQISFAILLSTIFSSVKTASVIGVIYILGGSMLAVYFNLPGKRKLLESKVLRSVPIVALYEILTEFSDYATEVEILGEARRTWRDIAGDEDGLLLTLMIMVIEWPVLLLVGYYVDQVGGNGSGVRKHPLWFFPCFQMRSKRYKQSQGHEILISLEKSDVSQEREKVKRLLQDSDQSYKIIVDDLMKTYPPRDGNPVKLAVRGLSLAIAEGECFGMLGPNGAGKTSFISMMTGLTIPTSGAALVAGSDIRQDMDVVYTAMGVCPQHDLLWEVLTGREHLCFYGRLKNLTEAELISAVDESLASVNLSEKGNTKVKQYSGGMKRRLSVAISLIGEPKAVYMDEPSTGLDPASRKSLWSAVEQAKKNKAIILTTHSMEEAEYLCDRVGIFVDGGLQCIGHPKELRERYGGYFLLTITTPINQEEEVEKMMHRFSPTAKKVYHIAGTQKYHLPKKEVTVADIFREVERYI